MQFACKKFLIKIPVQKRFVHDEIIAKSFIILPIRRFLLFLQKTVHSSKYIDKFLANMLASEFAKLLHHPAHC